MGAIRAALFAAALLALFLAAPASGSAPRAHGRELLAQFPLPVDGVLDAASAGAASTSASARERPVATGLPLWSGPLQAAGVGRNPYTMVVTVVGTSRAAGEVRARWHGGWDVRESAQATREVRMPAASGVASAAGAGVPLTLTLVGKPLSFRGQRQVSAQLHQMAVSNIDVHDVQLQVWSGPAPFALASLSVQRPQLLVITLLCAAGWWLLRGRPAAAQRPRDAVDTQLPVVCGTRTEAANSLLPRPAPAIDTLPAPPRPREQGVRSVPPASASAAAAAVAPQPSPASSVVAALHDVLHGGVAAPAVADLRVRQRRHAPGAAAQG